MPWTSRSSPSQLPIEVRARLLAFFGYLGISLFMIALLEVILDQTEPSLSVSAIKSSCAALPRCTRQGRDANPREHSGLQSCSLDQPGETHGPDLCSLWPGIPSTQPQQTQRKAQPFNELPLWICLIQLLLTSPLFYISDRLAM